MIASRICTAYYFVHFLIILPLLGLVETPLPLPNSILESRASAGEQAAVGHADRRRCGSRDQGLSASV